MSAKYSYPCIILQKSAWEFKIVQFYAEASDLKRWCGVYRKHVSQKGYQRILKRPHYEKIKKYLDDEQNVIPNSIVIAFNDALEIDGKTMSGASLSDFELEHPCDPTGSEDTDTEYGVGRLNVMVHHACDTSEELDEIKVSEVRSAYIIDGQHRIAGGNASVQDVYFPVTAFLRVTREDQAFHFIVINRQAQKVSTHDIDAVIPKAIFEKLQDRLLRAGLTRSDADVVYALDNLEESPFFRKIRWANNPNKDAPIQKGAIDKLITSTKQLPEDLKDAFGGGLPEIICAIWRGVNHHVSDLWESQLYEKGPSEHYQNQFLKKVVAVIPAIQQALNKLAEVGTINADGDDPKQHLEDTVYAWIKKIPLELFYCRWIPTSITNDRRIAELSDNLVKAARKKKVPYGESGNNWFDSPESVETIKAKKEGEKKAKVEAKRAEREKKKAAKKVKPAADKAKRATSRASGKRVSRKRASAKKRRS